MRPRILATFLIGGVLVIELLPLWKEISWPLVFTTGLFFFGTLFECYQYKPLSDEEPGPGWEKTDETFIDTASGKTVVVYYNSQTGERAYISTKSTAKSQKD